MKFESGHSLFYLDLKTTSLLDNQFLMIKLRTELTDKLFSAFPYICYSFELTKTLRKLDLEQARSYNEISCTFNFAREQTLGLHFPTKLFSFV